jgi:hypothetical protein
MTTPLTTSDTLGTPTTLDVAAEPVELVYLDPSWLLVDRDTLNRLATP